VKQEGRIAPGVYTNGVPGYVTGTQLYTQERKIQGFQYHHVLNDVLILSNVHQ
jgi:hypothetical protein